MGIKLANNAFGTLASGIASGATSITLTTGHGARFPSLSAGDYFYATLIDTSNNLEIVKCTARSTDVLTVVRAQEGTTARAYSAGDRVEIRLTAQTFLDATNIYDMLTSATGYFDLPAGTTAQRPASPDVGMIRYNTSLEALEMYDGANWAIVKSVFTATGGTVTEANGYRIHTFTSSGTFQVTKGSTEVEYLIIAGGGGAACAFGGGGGAGGYRCSVPGELSGGSSVVESKVNVSVASYSVIVGAGGAGGDTGGSPKGANGSNSSALGITSVGGGTSGSYESAPTYSYGDSGGSGGGGGSSETSTTYAGGSGTSGQGTAGGYGYGRNGYLGGGGGGAGAAGGNAVANTKSGDGGAGLYSSITGTSVARGGGGSGAAYNYSNGTVDGTPGIGGGGAGRSTSDSISGLPGTANTGGGGGGGGYITGPGGNGGSGVVIIRYKI